MHERWRERAEEIGLSREAIQETFDSWRARSARDKEPSVAKAMAVGTEVTASASHFDRRDVVQAVAGMRRDGMAAADVERVADEFLASEKVLRIASAPKGDRFTTTRVWEMEQRALDTAQRMRTEGTHAAGAMVAERVLCAHPTLKSDQREMVRRLLADREGVSVVIGEAETGKSYAILVAARGWSEAGMELRVAAPTWRAANVLRAEGLQATSVASLLAELGRAEAAGERALAFRSVLLVDEAGMVDSANIARLIHHADAAEAKLVLVGDPEQLGEIGAGGMFRALAERSDPIHLDEVIRHEFEVEREGARLIREGEGAQALDLYRSEERVVVATDADARREVMASEWHESFAAGEDAVMVAKQNVEVERLNAMARELRREAGQLGEREIEVGEARFAAGDQVITRVNDREADIYNRERWQVAEVDPDRGRVVLEGIDQDRTVEVGAEYLAKTNPHSEAPALQHAYAVTTYSAQGSTVDRAFAPPTPRWTSRRCMWRPRARAGRRRSTRRRRSRPRERRSPPATLTCAGQSRTSPKHRNETARSGRPMTRRSEMSCASCRRRSWCQSATSLRARPVWRAAIKNGTGELSAGSSDRRKTSTTPPGSEKRPKQRRARYAATRCPRRKPARRTRARGSRSYAASCARCRPFATRPAPNCPTPISFSPSAARPRSRPPSSPRPTTSPKSWASAQAIPRSERPGTRASQRSSATARITGSRTPTMPSGASAAMSTTGTATRPASACSSVRPSCKRRAQTRSAGREAGHSMEIGL